MHPAQPFSEGETMEETVYWLTRLIGFDTGGEGTDAKACRDFIAEELSSRGVSVYPFDTQGSRRRGYHLAAEVKGPSPLTVMLHAHLDTAGWGDASLWAAHPLSGLRRKGCILGRGALDCKGPAAVWMKIICGAAAGKYPFTLRLLVTDLEEEGGKGGLGELLREHPWITGDVKLVIGEGGGYPFPFGDRVFYTFQTAEREEPGDEEAGEDYPPERIRGILLKGIEKGFYSPDILEYFEGYGSISGRRLLLDPLYEGMDSYFDNAPACAALGRFGGLFERALSGRVPGARIMGTVTPGFSDNRFFRKEGIPVIGFFPLELSNSISGIHGRNEYISEGSLALAAGTVSDILAKLTEGSLL